MQTLFLLCTSASSGGPGYSSRDTLTALATTSLYASGSSSESSSATYSYFSSGGSGAGTLTNTVGGAAGNVSPSGALEFTPLDGALVPTVGADRSGGEAGGDSAPVAANVSLDQLDADESWRSGTEAIAEGSVHFLRYSADSILPALATKAGGEAVVLPE